MPINVHQKDSIEMQVRSRVNRALEKYVPATFNTSSSSAMLMEFESEQACELFYWDVAELAINRVLDDINKFKREAGL